MAFCALYLGRRVTRGNVPLSQAKFCWQRSIFAKGFSSQPSRPVSAPLVLKASRFAHLFEEGPTEAIYRGTPLEGLPQYLQGRLAEAWARSVLQEQNPDCVISRPEPGTCSDGRSRSLHNARYDFLMDGRRVEVKSARLTWSATRFRWLLRFWSVKLPFGKRYDAEFDDLYLVALSPHGLSLVKHDLRTGVSTNGQRTESDGHIVEVQAAVGEACWEGALGKILAKLCERGSCNLITKESFHSPCLRNIVSKRGGEGQTADFACGPMDNMSLQKRGLRIQAVGIAIDEILNPLSHVKSLEKAASAPADWLRDGKRIELKSSGMNWDSFWKRWRCSFQSIKPDLFDELWLAIRGPLGIHFYRVQSLETLGLATLTLQRGLTKQFYGPAHEKNSLKAFEIIEAKMLSKNCKKLAVVKWDHTGLGKDNAEKMEVYSVQ